MANVKESPLIGLYRRTSRGLPQTRMKDPQRTIPIEDGQDATQPIVEGPDRGGPGGDGNGGAASRGGAKALVEVDTGELKLFGVSLEFLRKLPTAADLDAFGDRLLDGFADAHATLMDVSATGTTDASGNLTMAPAQFLVPQGYTWDLRRLAVMGGVDAAAVPCTVRVFKDEVSALKVVDPSGVVIPTVTTFSRNQGNYRSGEQVVVRVAGFTATAGVACMLSYIATRVERDETRNL